MLIFWTDVWQHLVCQYLLPQPSSMSVVSKVCYWCSYIESLTFFSAVIPCIIVFHTCHVVSRHWQSAEVARAKAWSLREKFGPGMCLLTLHWIIWCFYRPSTCFWWRKAAWWAPFCSTTLQQYSIFCPFSQLPCPHAPTLWTLCCCLFAAFLRVDGCIYHKCTHPCSKMWQLQAILSYTSPPTPTDMVYLWPHHCTLATAYK